MIRANKTKELETLRQHVVELEGLLTEREGQKESLLQIGAEERYRAILESSDDCLLVLDRKDGVIDVNNELAEITAIPGAQLLSIVSNAARP